MVNLNVLRVVDLRALAKECKIKLKSGRKADYIKQIQSAGIKEADLKELVDKYKKAKASGKANITKLEQRVDDLEKQMSFMMKKLGRIEAKISAKEIQPISNSDLNIYKIKQKLISLISKGDSRTVDELMQIKTFKKIPNYAIEQAIIELIDEEIFDGAAGGSKIKIDDSIGRIIRR
jgi:hypothetical protein